MAKGNGGNGHGNNVIATRLADALAARGVRIITPEMKKKLGDALVVMSGNGKTFVLNGGHHLGVEDGVGMSTEEFNQRRPDGNSCLHNPKFKDDGSLEL